MLIWSIASRKNHLTSSLTGGTVGNKHRKSPKLNTTPLVEKLNVWRSVHASRPMIAVAGGIMYLGCWSVPFSQTQYLRDALRDFILFC